MLNRDTEPNGNQQIEPVDSDPRINLHPPTCSEIEKALKKMRTGKAPGMDNIAPEILKADIETSAKLLHPLLERIWNEEKLPAEWKKGLIVKIPKKGDTTNCDNWRGITLLSVPSTVLSRIILERVKDVVEMSLRREQAGFRKHHSCVDLIKTLRVILEQSAEWQNTLYLTFIDFEKAFDSVNRRVMWQTLEEYGIPQNILNIIKDMYEGYKCQVVHMGDLTEPIDVTSGVRQGCIISSTLFLLVLDSVLRRVYRGQKRGIQWGLQDALEDLVFADDICLLAQRFRDMEEKIKRLKEEAEGAGLKININKTKEMRINSKTDDKLSIDDEEIEQVDTFIYLGSMVSKKGGAEEDIKSRIRKANGAFVQLYPTWRNKNIYRKTKLRLFNTNVKSVLLYGCETWKVTQKTTKQLKVFVNRCLRRIINRRWPDVISNEDLWKETNQRPIEMQIRERKWGWIGHTLRKAVGAIKKTALDWNPQGARKRGRPKTTWKRTIEEECRTVGKTWSEVKRLADNRIGWRCFTEALCSKRSNRK